MDRRPTTVWSVAIVAAAVALLASAFLYGTPRDEEEFRFAVLSAWIRVRALADGAYPYWFSQLGLGVPQPFIPHFGLHPLLPILAAVSPVSWIRVLLLTHTVVGAAGMWMACRYLRLPAIVAAVCTVTYLLSTPVQNYVLSDFWPSHFLVWTTSPWILWLTWRILEGRPQRPWRAGLLLGLVTGLMVANTNPGHAVAYAPLALGVVAASARAIGRQWAALALALCVVAAIAAPNAAHLLNERVLFPQPSALSNDRAALPVDAVVQDMLRPLRGTEGTRTLFLGAPFSLFALAGCVWFAAARSDLVLTAFIASFMLFTDWLPVPWLSARYQFRDPLTLCAILLAGCAIHRMLGRRVTRPVATIALLAQAAVMAAAVWPLIQETWEPEGLRAAAFRGATGDALIGNALVAAMRTPGRLLYSPRVEYAVAERMLVDDGVGINALAYRGVAVVNGSFKAVSTDTLWPNDRLFYAWIRTPQALLDSDAALDVLGIRYVLSERGEQVASGLREIWAGTTLRGAKLTLLENSDAGPGAFLVDPDRVKEMLPTYPACGHDRLFCRDIGQLNGVRDRDVTAIDRGVNEMRIAWQPAPRTRLLVVTEMHRPAWTALSGNEMLQTHSVYDGFLGVVIPPGVSSVHLRYRPRVIMAASFISYGVIAIALVTLAVTARSASKRSPTRTEQPS